MSLEQRSLRGERKYTDIWLATPSASYAIELKYLTRRLSTDINGEPIDLADQSAQDIIR